MKFDEKNQTISIETLEEAKWLAEKINSPSKPNDALKKAKAEYDALLNSTKMEQELKKIRIPDTKDEI